MPLHFMLDAVGSVRKGFTTVAVRGGCIEYYTTNQIGHLPRTCRDVHEEAMRTWARIVPRLAIGF